MKKILLFVILAIFSINLVAQDAPGGFNLANYGVRIEAEKRLMIVLATLEMARTRNDAGEYAKLVNTPLSDKGSKFREQLQKDNETLPEDLRQKISTFIVQYKRFHPKSTDAELVSPFISMAYTLTPVPELADPVITTDLPGNLLDVLDFAPLVREFYRRSTIAGKLDEYRKTYQNEADGVLRSSTRDMVSELLDYMHTRPQLFFTEKVTVETQKGKSKSSSLQKVENRIHERRFYVVPEMLAPQASVNFLNVRDDYFVILPPDKDLSYSDVRRAFLQFVIDPLVLSNSREISIFKDWAKPILDERRKSNADVSPDVFLAVTRSLVAAVDVRETENSKIRIATDQSRLKIGQMKTEAEKRMVSADLEKYKQTLADESALRLYEDYEKGALLSFYFSDQLNGLEDSGFDIASSLREMIATFDPLKEKDRTESSAEARKRAVAARAERKNHPEIRTIAADNPVTTRLLEIQKTIDAKNFVKASSDLNQLLAQNPSEPRIYYNIGRVASLSAENIADPDAQARKLLEAKTAYSNVIRSATNMTDKALLSLTYVALGRIFEFENIKDYAAKLYDKAIEFGEITGGAYKEALDAKQRLLRP